MEAHSPIEIDAANRARQRLRRISPAHKRKTDIKDDRLPKRSGTPYTHFTKSKWASGEFAGESFADAASSIAKQWKSLSAAEKKVCLTIGRARDNSNGLTPVPNRHLRTPRQQMRNGMRRTSSPCSSERFTPTAPRPKVSCLA